MKLLIITSIKEDEQNAASILKEAQIPIFSVTNTIGIKAGGNVDLLDNWFSNGEGQFDSVILFSFTTEEKAKLTLELVKGFNTINHSEFPIRGFILNVEQSI